MHKIHIRVPIRSTRIQQDLKLQPRTRIRLQKELAIRPEQRELDDRLFRKERKSLFLTNLGRQSRSVKERNPGRSACKRAEMLRFSRTQPCAFGVELELALSIGVIVAVGAGAGAR